MSKQALNERLRTVKNLGQLQALLDDAEAEDFHLVSKRTANGSHRELFGFTSGRADSMKAGKGHYISDPASLRTAYLYNDSVSSGEAAVANLHRIAEFQEG